MAIITKLDLAAVVEFQVAEAEANISAIRPNLPVFYVSSKTGAGMAEWIDFLISRRQEVSAGSNWPCGPF